MKSIVHLMNMMLNEDNCTQRPSLCAVGGFIYSSAPATVAERCY
jgi:hypothetical protein